MSTPKHVEDAIRALAHRLYDRDHQEPDDRPSTTDFAFEFIRALQVRGWTYKEPPPPPGPGPKPDTYARGAALARQALPRRTEDGDADDAAS